MEEYLLRVQQKKPIVKTEKEKWIYTCTQRGELELGLRKMVKTILRIAYKTENDAKEMVIKKIYNKNDRKYATYSYADLFDSRKSNIYLKDLKVLILANWEYFSDFWDKQDMFVLAMETLNKEGRFDAHATIPTDDEIIIINSSLNIINKGLMKFKNM